MTGQSGFSARFWGVRGSIACPGPSTLRYGGNTTCVEIRCDGRLVVLDAGTGLRPLGVSLLQQGPVDMDILFTHTHFDHVTGLPFFIPAYRPGNRIRMWAGHLGPGPALYNAMCKLMAAPLFPVPMTVMGAKISCEDFEAGDSLDLGRGLHVATTPLNHPNGATGYRLNYGGRSICLITDTEHDGGAADDRIVDLVRGADIFIYDSTYTNEEYERFRGWGHSTWQVGADLADRAGVRTFVIFHHDPGHDDDFMDRIAAEAEARRPGTLVAREGMHLEA